MEALPANETAVEQYVRLNERVHRILREGCPWRRIHRMIDTLWKGIPPPITPSLLKDQIREARQEHRLMLEHAKARGQKSCGRFWNNIFSGRETN